MALISTQIKFKLKKKKNSSGGLNRNVKLLFYSETLFDTQINEQRKWNMSVSRYLLQVHMVVVVFIVIWYFLVNGIDSDYT